MIKEVDLTCEYCNNIYHVESRRALETSRYCSDECFDKSRFGSNNPIHRVKDRELANKHISDGLNNSEKFQKAKNSDKKIANIKKALKNSTYVLSDETRQKYRENALKTLKILQKKKSTKIERKTEDILKEYKVIYETQKSFLGITRVDFYIPGLNTIVYCDGDYWHNLPNYKIRDKRQNTLLRKAGYTVLRFWEHEINSTNAKCVIDGLINV